MANKKQRATFALDVDLIRKARQAVRQGAAPSLVGLVVRGLKLVLGAIERERGQRFRVRPIKLRAGRKQRRAERDKNGRPKNS